MRELDLLMAWTFFREAWPVVILPMLGLIAFLTRIYYRLEARMIAVEGRIADVMQDREQDLLRAEKQRTEDIASAEKGRDLLRQELVAMRAEVRGNLELILGRLK